MAGRPGARMNIDSEPQGSEEPIVFLESPDEGLSAIGDPLLATGDGLLASVPAVSSLIRAVSPVGYGRWGRGAAGMVGGGNRFFSQDFQPGLRFRVGRFTMCPMDDMTPLPEFLIRLPEGVIRVAGTRVSLESVVRAFQDGATPEEICLDFPSLDLAKIDSVLAYDRTRRDTIDAYLLAQQRCIERLARNARRIPANFSLS